MVELAESHGSTLSREKHLARIAQHIPMVRAPRGGCTDLCSRRDQPPQVWGRRIPRPYRQSRATATTAIISKIAMDDVAGHAASLANGPSPRLGCALVKGPSYSMTSSARTRTAGEISIPIARATLWLITSSNLVGCWAGVSPGGTPFSIFSVKAASMTQPSDNL